MSNQYIDHVKSLLDYLREEEPVEAVETTLERINRLTNQHEEVSVFLINEYFANLILEDDSGLAFLKRFLRHLKEGAHFSLAFCVSCALIGLWKTHADDAFALQLVELMISYGMEDKTEVIIQKNMCKITINGHSPVLIPYKLMPSAVKPGLLRMALKHAFFREETLDGNHIDFGCKSQRINDIILLLLALDQSTKSSMQYLHPFLFDQICYSSLLAIDLFGEELSISEYEHELLDVYGIPLLPLIEQERLQFIRLDKIVIGNSGQGFLPISCVRIAVDGQELEVGDLAQKVYPGQEAEIYIEDPDIVYDFLKKQRKAAVTNVIFEFHKFGYSYELIVPSVAAGRLIEGANHTALELALPYELPLQSLSEKEFERLCYWIVEEGCDGRFGEVLRLNEDGGGERGRDVLATELATNRKFVFQCKRVENFHPGDIEEELNTFARYVVASPDIRPDVYVLFVSSAITDKTKTKGESVAKQIGMDIQYWSKSTIDRLVRKNKTIQDRFWKKVQHSDNA